MDITFCGPAVPALDGGISYRIIVNGHTVVCRMTTEVLQDINPSLIHLDAMGQFEANVGTLLNIAEEKIRRDGIQDNQVWVRTADL
jgi:hypothetical protein